MKNGPYELVRAPGDYPGKKYRGKYCYEHHLVVWKALGVVIEGPLVVHHKNGDRRDNRIENLEVMTAREHNDEHNAPTFVRLSCPGCGTTFVKRFVGTHLRSGRKSKYTACSRRLRWTGIRRPQREERCHRDLGA